MGSMRQTETDEGKGEGCRSDAKEEEKQAQRMLGELKWCKWGSRSRC